MNENISTMVNILYDNKQNIKDNDYIILMDSLKELSKLRPKIYNKKHRVSYKLTTDICFIEDFSQFEDIKKDLFSNSSYYYNESDEDFNEDYERVKSIETEGVFYCYSDEIISKETHTRFEILRLIGEARKHIADYYINPDVYEEHAREVQEYYFMYKKQWDNWIRIKYTTGEILFIDDVTFVPS